MSELPRRRLKVQQLGGLNDGFKLLDAETGQEFEGVSSVTVEIKPNDIVSTTLKFESHTGMGLIVEINTDARPTPDSEGTQGATA